MLHEDVTVDWVSLTNQVQDSKGLSELQPDFIQGGVTYYVGRRPRTREVLQKRMYMAEIEKWVVEHDVQERNAHIFRDDETITHSRLIGT